jgi:hypothetical protein
MACPLFRYQLRCTNFDTMAAEPAPPGHSERVLVGLGGAGAVPRGAWPDIREVWALASVGAERLRAQQAAVLAELEVLAHTARSPYTGGEGGARGAGCVWKRGRAASSSRQRARKWQRPAPPPLPWHCAGKGQPTPCRRAVCRAGRPAPRRPGGAAAADRRVAGGAGGLLQGGGHDGKRTGVGAARSFHARPAGAGGLQVVALLDGVVVRRAVPGRADAAAGGGGGAAGGHRTPW